MSEDEAVNAINQALDTELQGLDYNAIADQRLRSLDLDYAMTQSAERNPIEMFKEAIGPGEPWEADFEDEFYELDNGYQMCPSDSSEEDVESKEEEIEEEAKADSWKMSESQIASVKRIMSSIDLKAPGWMSSLPDSVLISRLKSSVSKK
jgi:hypothetical protein